MAKIAEQASSIAPKTPLEQIAQDLISYTRDQAKSAEKLGFTAAIQDYDKNQDKDIALLNSVKAASELKTPEKLQAANALAAERIVLNALGNMQRKMATPSPGERFKAYFESGLVGSEQDQDAFIDTLKRVRNDMVISVVQTMHPTIYHTEFARQSETALTQKLEAIVHQLKRIAPEGRSVTSPLIPGLLGEAKELIKDIVKDITTEGDARKPVTPKASVTVAEENILDRKNHIAMQTAFHEVADQYNRGLNDVVTELSDRHQITQEQATILRSDACKIQDSQAVWRTWAYGADADGRELSTSIVLSQGIYHQVGDDRNYPSRKRDVRENAHDQKESVSCLIQRAYWKSGDFRKFCDAFIEAHAGLKDKRIDWKNPLESTVMQLSAEEQEAIFHALVTGDYRLKGTDYTPPASLKHLQLVPPSLADQTVAFNNMFRKLYPEFLKKEGIPTVPLPELTSLEAKYGEEHPDILKKLADAVKKERVECGPQREWIHFELDVKDKEPDNGEVKPSKAKKEPKEFVYYPRRGDNTDFFNPALRTSFTTDEQGLVHAKNDKLEGPARRKLLDVVKRLQVLNGAIGELGNKVADRYQVANFENAADFYSTLLLFKETGIIEVNDKGEVVGKPADAEGKGGTPKLSLQPLLETEQDQAKAPAMFEKLLKDPFVRSYYKALGHADIMLGYSDGSKSAGNFASEWSIRNCAKKLQDTFNSAFKDEPLPVHFFHGRGRGDSRGGQFDEGQNQRMNAPEIQQAMRYDETIQSDGPMNGAISRARGEDMLTSIVIGTTTAAREAKQEFDKRKDPAYQAFVNGAEAAISSIADKSKEGYLALVGTNINAEKLLNVVHDNPYKASRAATRGRKSFESMRAIPVEYGFNMVDAPLHYLGLKTALENFVKKTKIKDKDGDEVKGMRALEVLYEGHPFFRNMIDKTIHGLQDYDPAVFTQYAEVAGVSDWAKSCNDELEGLREMAQSIAKRTKTLEAIRDSNKGKEGKGPLAKKTSFAELVASGVDQKAYDERANDALRAYNIELDKAAHALALSSAYKDGVFKQVVSDDDNPLKPMENTHPAEAELMRSLAFLTSEQNRTRGLFPPAAITAGIENKVYMAH